MLSSFTENDLANALDSSRFETSSVRLIGSGVSGAVFKVRQKRPDRDVAIKVSQGAHANNSLAYEATVLTQPELKSFTSDWQNEPVLCQVYNKLDLPGRVALVMEYLDPALYASLDVASDRYHSKWTDYQILRIIAPFVALLARAHDQGFIYADISRDKAGHILWNETTGVVKSYDWANVVDTSSPTYNQAITPAQDMRGCGEVLHLMRHGRHIPLPSRWEDLRRHSKLTEIIRRACDPTTPDRFKTMTEMEQAIRDQLRLWDEQVNQLEQEFTAVAAQVASKAQKRNEDIHPLFDLQERIARINPQAEALSRVSPQLQRLIEAETLRRLIQRAQDDLRRAVAQEPVSLKALSQASANLENYDVLRAKDPTLPLPPGDRVLLGLLRSTLEREKPRVDEDLKRFVADCVLDSPPYPDLLRRLLAGQPALDNTPDRPLLSYLARQAGQTLIRLETRHLLATVTPDIIDLEADVTKTSSIAQATLQHQLTQLKAATNQVGITCQRLIDLDQQGLTGLTRLSNTYEALRQGLQQLARETEQEQAATAECLAQSLTPLASLAAQAKDAYQDGRFSETRARAQQICQLDVENLALARLLPALDTLSRAEISQFQATFQLPEDDQFEQRMADYRSQALQPALDVAPRDPFLKGQDLVLGEIIQPVLTQLSARSDLKGAARALSTTLGGLLPKMADRSFLIRLDKQREAGELDKARELVATQVSKALWVEQAVNQPAQWDMAKTALEKFSETSSQVAQDADLEWLRPFAEATRPLGVDAGTKLGRAMFSQRETPLSPRAWPAAKAVYDLMSPYGDASVQAEQQYVQAALAALGPWGQNAFDETLSALGKLEQQVGIETALVMAVGQVRSELTQVRSTIGAAAQTLQRHVSTLPDFCQALQQCLQTLRKAEQSEDSIIQGAQSVPGQGMVLGLTRKVRSDREALEKFLTRNGLAVGPTDARVSPSYSFKPAEFFQVVRRTKSTIATGILAPVYASLEVALRQMTQGGRPEPVSAPAPMPSESTPAMPIVSGASVSTQPGPPSPPSSSGASDGTTQPLNATAGAGLVGSVQRRGRGGWFNSTSARLGLGIISLLVIVPIVVGAIFLIFQARPGEGEPTTSSTNAGVGVDKKKQDLATLYPSTGGTSLPIATAPPPPTETPRPPNQQPGPGPGLSSANPSTSVPPSASTVVATVASAQVQPTATGIPAAPPRATTTPEFEKCTTTNNRLANTKTAKPCDERSALPQTYRLQVKVGNPSYGVYVKFNEGSTVFLFEIFEQETRSTIQLRRSNIGYPVSTDSVGQSGATPPITDSKYLSPDYHKRENHTIRLENQRADNPLELMVIVDDQPFPFTITGVSPPITYQGIGFYLRNDQQVQAEFTVEQARATIRGR